MAHGLPPHHTVDVVGRHARPYGGVSSVQDLSAHPTHYPHALDLLRRPADDCASGGKLALGPRPTNTTAHIAFATITIKHVPHYALACCCLFLCSMTACPPVLPVAAHSGCSMLSGTCQAWLHNLSTPVKRKQRSDAQRAEARPATAG